MTEANTISSVSVDSRVMANAVERASRVMEKRNTIPILGMIQVDAWRKRLSVSATDLDVHYSTVILGQTKGRGRFLLDRSDASRIFKRMPPSSIELRPNGISVEAFGEGFEISIASIATSDNLPLVIDENDEQDGPAFLVEAKALRAAMEDVRHSISAEETRYYLNGVYLAAAGAGRSLEAVSTDGHRLMQTPLPYRYPPNGSRAKVLKNGGIIVPRKTIGLLLALAPTGEEPITVTLWRKKAQKGGPTRVRFEWLGEKIETKLIDGTFPDYKKVVPTVGVPDSKYARIVIDVEKVARALESCIALAGAKLPHVKLSKGDDGKLALDITEGGKSKVRSAADAIVQGDMKFPIAFNANYLVDALRRFSGPTEFWLLDPAAPAVLRRGEMLVPDRRAILMPVRIS